jgi:SNF2 family DNA or RNA helicase
MATPLNRRRRSPVVVSTTHVELALHAALRTDCTAWLESTASWCINLPISIERDQIRAAPAGVVSSPLGGPLVRTVGCIFERVSVDSKTSPQAAESGPPKVMSAARASSGSASAVCVRSSQSSVRRHTRIRPPRDLVKLEDRLRLLLQPPLEMLLAAGSLRFACTPFPYQLDGIAFLYPREQAVLADEMGLGKTMQAVMAIRLLAHQRQVRRVLLVCPKPLVTNWLREFRYWAPELPIAVIKGTAPRRRWLWRQHQAVVSIANYEAVVRDRAEVCEPANQYDLVVLDESQRIKNVSSATNEAVRAIQRRRSWALTGTPIENSVDDLVGIFEFVAPGQVSAKMKPRAIGRAVGDYVLRRTKDAVLNELPPKLIRDAEVELSAEQAESYRLAEDEGVIRLRKMQRELTIQHVLELVLRLKQICNFDPATGASSKLERLEADLEECAASGRKAIIFSQWVQTIVELRQRLARFGPVEYHGQIPHSQREAAIQQFRDDPCSSIILMSYGAGSVGLNLQFASYVFLFDRWWNPAVEDQAINRAHRIGVQSPVTVSRFLTLGTIEERIHQILVQKRALFDTVFGDQVSGPSCGLSRDEIFSLFGLDSHGAAA